MVSHLRESQLGQCLKVTDFTLPLVTEQQATLDPLLKRPMGIQSALPGPNFHPMSRPMIAQLANQGVRLRSRSISLLRQVPRRPELRLQA